MPLAASTKLSPHFTARELGANLPEADDAIVANLKRTAQWLEAARTLNGDNPILVTSGFRTAAHNREIGGSETSDHVVGLAADFKVQNITAYESYQRFREAIVNRSDLRIPRFDQLIWYAVDDHIHVGLGARMRGEVLLKTTEGSYVALAGHMVSQLRGYV